MGDKSYLTYEEFKRTDFWSFFHVKEIDSQPLDDGKTLLRLKTGGFQSQVDLNIIVNQRKQLVEGQITLRRTWVVGPPFGINPFALDIVRSFIATLVPLSDQSEILELIRAFHQSIDPGFVEQLLEEGLEKSKTHEAVSTYFGYAVSFELPLKYSSIMMLNFVRDTVELLQTRIIIDAFDTKQT